MVYKPTYNWGGPSCTKPGFTQCRCFLVHAILTNSTYPLGRVANQLSNSVACHTSAIKPNSWYKVGPPVMPIGSESPHDYYSYKHHESYLLEVPSGYVKIAIENGPSK